jgi:hypothetical protein
VLGVPANDTDDAMRAFVDRHALGGVPQLVDDDGTIWARFGVAYQPAWVFLGPGGEREVVAGALSEQALEERLAALGAGG